MPRIIGGLRRGRDWVLRGFLLGVMGLGGTVLTTPLLAQRRADPEAILFLDIPSVRGASKFDQIETEAPASVTVVTAEEIARRGWRTLGEVLSSVRGFFVTNDRTYSYLAVRGFGRPGDFSSRVLLLLDGERTNDLIYDSGAYGTDAVVDLSEIDRIEIIRGPGSSLYGASAFFGVVNLITRRGRDLEGGRVSANGGSSGTASLRGTFGRRFHSGVELLASGLVYRRAGQDLYYPEFDDPATNDGIARFDRDRREHAMIKLTGGPLTLEGTFNDRLKHIPTASFGTVFNDPRTAVRDQNGLVVLKVDQPVASGSRVTASLAFNSYLYRGWYALEEGLSHDLARGRSLNLEATYLHPLGQRQKLIAGAKYRLSLAQDQESWTEGDPSSRLVDATRTNLWAVFAQDEIRLGRLILNAGARLDHYESFGETVNPRAALVYPWKRGAVKLLYGQAFRAPNNWELYYQDGYSIKANPGLDPETIATTELVLEHQLGKGLRGGISAYDYRIRGLISQVLDPQDSRLVFRNAQNVLGRGVEAELELESRLVQGRASYALQRSEYRGTGAELSNSPRHLAQLNLAWSPVPGRVSADLTLQAMSGRTTPAGEPTDGFALGNFVLRGRQLWHGLGATVGVYNLWAQRYADPVGEEHRQRTIQQDGRQVQLTVAYQF